jgi:hypothetical protein
MTRGEVIEHFDRLSGDVAKRVYSWEYEADSLRKSTFYKNPFQFDDEIMEFIEKAVEDAIEKHKEEGTETVK